jgi:hypothetical protein
MYIEDRLFSETSGEVKYYSVVLSEDEYALYTEFLEEREFASVRQAKKLMKKAIKATTQQDSKLAGKVAAQMERSGMGSFQKVTSQVPVIGKPAPNAKVALSAKPTMQTVTKNKFVVNSKPMTQNAADRLGGAVQNMVQKVKPSKAQGVKQQASGILQTSGLNGLFKKF